jgi:ribonuclease HI
LNERPTVTIYTDGGSRPNPGPGGWGALLIAANGTQKELSGAEPDTTNNRMELTAAIEALRALKQPCVVDLHTDSQYLKRGITEWIDDWVAKNWRADGKKPVQNKELWQALYAETQRHDIRWQWVKGHAGNAHNEHVDRLATAAREQMVRASGGQPALPPVDVEIALRVSVPKTGGRGGYAIRVSPTADDVEPRVLTGSEDATNSYRLELVAALDALRSTDAGTVVRVFCPSDTLQRGMTQWVRGWQRSGWRTKEGQPVKHQDLWQALVSEAQQRMVDWLREQDAPPVAEGLAQLAGDIARQT